MKLDRTAIGIIIAGLVILVTINAWVRVKDAGRRARIAAESEGPIQDAGREAD